MNNGQLIKRDKELYMSSVSQFEKDDDFFRFDIQENLQRLYKQSQGDSAFYFLSILSFIEGYFRYKYKTEEGFDFDSEQSIDLTAMINKIIDKLPNSQTKNKDIKNLHNIFNFMRTHSNKEYSFDPETHQRYLSKSPTIFFNTGDRIRHCFTKQTPENLALLLNTFLSFSKCFDFYNNNKDCIDKLLSDESYFSNMQNQIPYDDFEQLADIGYSLIRLMNKGSSEEKSKATELYNQNQLQQALYAKSWRDYQQMMSTLTEEQQTISDEILHAIKKEKKIMRLIKGGPGTGKTLILLNILQQTLNKNIILLTYTKPLTKYNKYLSGLVSFNKAILTEEEKTLLSERINCFDNYFSDIFGQILNKQIIHLSNCELPEIETICKKYRIRKDDLLYEANEVWLNLPNKNEFIGRTYAQPTPANIETQRIRESHYWPAITELAILFENNKDIYPLELAFYKCQDGTISFQDIIKPDYLFIDEIQDLEASKIEAIRRICKKGFILTGDLTQSVFVRKGLPWIWLKKKEIPVSDQKLTKNFRSTLPIQNLSNNYREVISLKDNDPGTISYGFMSGPTPEAYLSKSESKIYDKVIERIDFFKNHLYFDNKEFCIIAPNNKILETLKSRLLNTISIESEEFDFTNEKDLIKLSRLKYVKGIDLPVIMLILDRSLIDKEQNDNLDVFGQENSIYTCISRAMNILNIFFVDDGQLLKTPEAGQKQNAVLKLFNIMKDSVITLD